MGGSFAFTEAAVANTRQKDDAWNGAAGGCAAGFLAGIRGMRQSLKFVTHAKLHAIAHSLPVAVASCAVIGGAMGVYDTAGALAGKRRDAESFEERRRRFFKPKSSLEDATR